MKSLLLLALWSWPLFATEIDPRSIKWANEHIQNLTVIPEPSRASLYYLVNSLYCRLNDWRSYKPFYDELFTRAEVKKAYPDALPQDQTNAGMFMRVMDPGEKITDKSPLSWMAGKTVGEVFGYPGDMRLIQDTLAMGSRQLWIVRQAYFAPQSTGRYNDAYHEMGHVLHLSLLTPSEYAALEVLYATTKRNNNFMDTYAANSSSEYIAQALEAYLSETKPARGWPATHSWTRASMKAQDPALYQFIEAIVTSSHASRCKTLPQ